MNFLHYNNNVSKPKYLCAFTFKIATILLGKHASMTYNYATLKYTIETSAKF